jgi:hypothetical protein
MYPNMFTAHFRMYRMCRADPDMADSRHPDMADSRHQRPVFDIGEGAMSVRQYLR